LIEKLSSPGRVRIAGAPGGMDARVVAELANSGRDVLFIARDDVAGARLDEALQFFAPEVERIDFPSWDCLPYDRVSPNAAIVSQRIDALTRLLSKSEKKGRVVVATVRAFLQRVPPRDAFKGATLIVSAGDTVEPESLDTYLIEHGYHHAQTVMEPGEFAKRGGLVDIFPTGAEQPVRLDFFGDEVESLRRFDPATQRTTGDVAELALRPVSEVPLDEDAISRFRTGYRALFGAATKADALYEAVSEGRRHIGMEHWLPLFYDGRLETVLDYMAGAVVLFDHQTPESIEARLDLIGEYYGARKAMMGAAKGAQSSDAPLYKPVPPERLYLTPGDVDQLLKPFACAQLDPFDAPESVETLNAGAKAGREFSDARVNPDINVFDALGDHVEALEKEGRRALIGAFTHGTRERLMAVMGEHGLEPLVQVDGWADVKKLTKGSIGVAVLGLERGFVTEDLAIISEQDILGERLSRPGKRKVSADNFIADVTSLSEGDMVVHLEHGIAQYAGLVTLDVGGAAHDCLKLIYSGDDKLFLPVENIDVITRYGSEDAGANLDKLGGAGWQARKAGLKQRLKDMAEELIKIAAARELRQTERMAPDPGALDEFAARFAYHETEDQARAIAQVVSDLGEGRPPDRLVCGDVGFGKTEVAMRAAFIAVQNNKQVAMLVPTTLLAQQHYESFKDRFADWPIVVEVISRFKSTSEQNEALKKVAAGKVDVLIGTHKLLHGDIDYSSLGMLIIDEEHRFGVRQKEKLKALRANVDILTLTATPIPRTLNMALSGIRDLSLIVTPPARRLSVKTFVRQEQDSLVLEAVSRELLRGGQVFYLHNEVKSIENTAEHLRQLIPQARICVAHGQMAERDLEKIMADFYHKRYNILVCTTIIETGIDIPSANTILIHRADKFGLAQLHQLRGRVGRSHHQAYAYLLLPNDGKLSADANKRIEAIQSASTLGAGFTLASHDLEIRGAGELLGDEQSGHMQKIGFSLYTEMLEQAVAAIKSGRRPDLDQEMDKSAEINLRIPALIPEDYLPDVHLRLIMYKRISASLDDSDLQELQVEMIDRFGLLPNPLKLLFRVTQLKLKAEKYGIKKIDANVKSGRIEFKAQTSIDPMSLVEMIQNDPQTYKLGGANSLQFTHNCEDGAAKLDFISELLDNFKLVEPKAA